MNDISTILLYEILGTATLLLFGCGVVANVALAGSKGEGGGFLLVNFGWGIGVFAGVYVAWKSGAHLNPAVTLGVFAAQGNQRSGGCHILDRRGRGSDRRGRLLKLMVSGFGGATDQTGEPSAPTTTARR